MDLYLNFLILEGGIKLRMSLYEYNQIAYESAFSFMDRTGKAAIIHPTGTGKSFIGFKLSEQSPHEVLLYWWNITKGQVIEKALTNKQIKKLEDIGISWLTVSEQIWERNYKKLLEYFEKNGNIDMPYNYKTECGIQLSRWISKLKRDKLNLTDDQIIKLNSVDFFR